MDIYSYLKKDHKEVKDILSKLEKDPADTKMAGNLKKEMLLHNKAEEKAFYHPLKAKLGEIGIISEAGEKEHDLAMSLIDCYIKIDFKNKEKKILLSIIKKAIEAHIQVEEQEIFALAKKYFSNEEAKEINNEFEEIKEKMKTK